MKGKDKKQMKGAIPESLLSSWMRTSSYPVSILEHAVVDDHLIHKKRAVSTLQGNAPLSYIINHLSYRDPIWDIEQPL